MPEIMPSPAVENSITDMKLMKVVEPDASFWWTKTGLVLADMMSQAGYPRETQNKYLGFYFHCIIPALGPRPDPDNKYLIWPSFMTDDRSPIELSWAWEDNTGSPEVRFSIEPIQHISKTGLAHSGYAAIRQLATKNSDSTMIDGHKAQYLAAFDLSQASVTFKVYFIPTQRSHRDGIPAWDVVHAAFMEISEHNKPMRLALEKLSTFYRSCSEKCGLKVEFVGSDCLPASQARVKIYFRTSSTSFQSVRYIMALGGLLNSDNAEAALKKLRVLWNLVLGLDTDCTKGENQELPAVPHRTVGILYYFSLQRGKEMPTPKIYIPVCHYSKSDWQVAKCLAKSFGSNTKMNYSSMLPEDFLQNSLEVDLGHQTYIAAAFKSRDIVVTSYINPKAYTHLRATDETSH
ncbi:tryptophan dimethylallyltransferase-domain-containing protein [Leptodontidium sp. MPI-SDFR-AT-0119]|nr:tryptophan dimethylallyltransferase-domain-containing protein [Leptodontidium sp. MPI-SDFR-AT-0119]